MRRFLKSSIRFVGRVTWRALAGIILWLLDMTDLYSRYLEPTLPEKWAQFLGKYSEHFDIATPWVVAAIVLWAILYTYYEVDREFLRDPSSTKKLKEFYSKSGELLTRQIAPQELSIFQNDYDKWFTEVRDWISNNMEPASLTRFLHFEASLPYNHGSPANMEHQKSLNGINIYHKNLQAIIESQEWK